MIRILDGKTDGRFQKYKDYIGKEYKTFEDFVDSLHRDFDVMEVGAVPSDETVGYVWLADKMLFTEKSYLWFEDVNIINPRKYQKYL